MTRNMEKTIAQGKQIISKNDRLDLTLGELKQFFTAFNETAEKDGIEEALYAAIGEAFEMGLAVGMRNKEVTA